MGNKWGWRVNGLSTVLEDPVLTKDFGDEPYMTYGMPDV